MAPTQEIFALTLARPVVTPAGEHPHLVHLWWRLTEAAAGEEWLVQVYLDGALAACSTQPGQREVWLACDRRRPHRIELLGIPAAGAGPIDAIRQARPELLTSWSPRVHGELEAALVRDERLAVDTRIAVALDGRQVDRGELWPASENRGGFGAMLGLGEFGRDAITGPGLGVFGGELGVGPLGTDGTAWRWRLEGLPAGEHAVDLTAVGASGQPTAEPRHLRLTTEALPESARGLEMTGDFRLRWS